MSILVFLFFPILTPPILWGLVPEQLQLLTTIGLILICLIEGAKVDINKELSFIENSIHEFNQANFLKLQESANFYRGNDCKKLIAEISSAIENEGQAPIGS